MTLGPADQPQALSARSRTVGAARRLHRRSNRRAEGRFIAEGPQAVREALGAAAVAEVCVTEEARDRHRDIVDRAGAGGLPVHLVSDEAARALAATVTTQGLFAVCRSLDRPWVELLSDTPTLVAMLVEDRDPGNVGTMVRTADAAGADAILLSAGCVDVYNPKVVRASAGSLFHVPTGVEVDPAQASARARRQGMKILAADGGGSVTLPELTAAGELATPTMWVFGSEAHGLSDQEREFADAVVRIPVYGQAESLNVAVAASLCLYASAFSQRGADWGG